MTNPETLPDVTVVMVTFNSRRLVHRALESAQKAAEDAGLSAELIVVDNASTDGTADFITVDLPAAVVVRNDRNVGFGAANNIAFERARGRSWLLLNPDATLEAGALGRLVAVLASAPDIGAVGPSIRGGGLGAAESAGELPGLRSMAAHFLGLNRLIPGDRGGAWRGWQLRARPSDGLRPVGWLSGAAVLVRPEAIRGIGGFDPSIFLYGEDTDLSARLGQAGWRLALLPSAIAHHAIGGSQPATSARWVSGLDDYLRRRGRSRLMRRVCLLVAAVGLTVRAAAAAARGPSAHSRRMRAAAVEAMCLALGR